MIDVHTLKVEKVDSLYPRSLDVSVREAGSGAGHLLWGLRGHQAVQAKGTQVPEACTASWASPEVVLCPCLAGGSTEQREGHFPHLFLSDDSLFLAILEEHTMASSCMSHSMSTVILLRRKGGTRA